MTDDDIWCDDPECFAHDKTATPERILAAPHADAKPCTFYCDGLCVTSADIGIPGYGVAYPHPGCPLHDPGDVCGCGQPDRCLSPTHGQISMAEALTIRHRQNKTGGTE